ncbi:MAG: hypothetical protein KF856_01190 [Cyclobacteriaceae bacterium]|nr:hypothetical protein [Cyclobacteriaceae bacterium]MBX2913862.1 hypothetical protein [Cyclobacteriaceae bacterium]
MTQLYNAVQTVLSQLADVIGQISEEDFRKPSPALSQATLGQHLRHTLEFFVCLEQGYESGVVNYDKRQHDKAIENDKFVALGTINKILDFVNRKPADKRMIMEVGYLQDSEECVPVETNFMRELTYNIEHAVHHMAIMKIGIREVAPDTVIPKSFGVAVSTLRFREEPVATSR